MMILSKLQKHIAPPISLPVRQATPGAGPKCSYQHLAAKVEVLGVSFVCEFFQGGWPLAAKWYPAFICLCQHTDLLLSLLHWVEWKDSYGPWWQPPGKEGGQTYEVIARRLRGGSFLPALASLLSWLVLPWAMALVHARDTHTCVYSWRNERGSIRTSISSHFLHHWFSPLPPQSPPILWKCWLANHSF